MLKLVLFLSLFLLNICVYAAPAIENSSLQNVTELSSTEIAIRYDGAQLWRVDFDHDVAKQSVFALQRKFGIYLFVFFFIFYFQFTISFVFHWLFFLLISQVNSVKFQSQ